MLNPSHFVVTNPRKIRPKQQYWGGVQHKRCGHVRIITREAENFSDLLSLFSVECPACGVTGGPASWDSIPKDAASRVLSRLLKDEVKHGR